MLLPQLLLTYFQPLFDAIIAKIKPGDIKTANLPGLDISAWAPLGLSVNADGTVAELDQATYRVNLKSHLDTLGYVTGGGTAPAPAQLAAPGNPQASASSASAISVTASSVANASGYRLFHSASGANTFAQLGGTLATPAYSDTGLPAATTYDYQWQALGNGTSYSDSPRSATFSGRTSAATAPAPGQPTPLTQARVALQRNVLVTNSDFAGADGTSTWALTTNLSVAAGVDGYVQWVLSIPPGANTVGGTVLLNPGTALPSSPGEYLNTHGAKRDFPASGPLVITEGTGTNYPAVTQASGDIIKMATVGPQLVTSISHDNGATFSAFSTKPRHVDAGGAVTPLTLMLFGEAANVIHSVSYYNFS